MTRCDRTFQHAYHDVVDEDGKGFRCPGLTHSEISKAVTAWLDRQQPAAGENPTRPKTRPPRDPWALDVPYDVLHAGLRGIAATAVAADDYAGAAYAYSVLAGAPTAPDTDDADLEPLRIQMHDDGTPSVLNPEVLDGRGILWIPAGLTFVETHVPVEKEIRCRLCSRRVSPVWAETDVFAESGLCGGCLNGPAEAPRG